MFWWWFGDRTSAAPTDTSLIPRIASDRRRREDDAIAYAFIEAGDDSRPFTITYVDLSDLIVIWDRQRRDDDAVMIEAYEYEQPRRFQPWMVTAAPPVTRRIFISDGMVVVR